MTAAAAQLAIVPRSTEQWLSTEDAIRATGWSHRWLRALAAAGRVQARESAARAANGRPKIEYLASSLPGAQPETQLAVVPPADVAFGPLFASLPPQTARIALADPKAQKQAEERSAILTPILEFSADPQRFAHLRLDDGRPVTSQERMIEFVAARSGKSIRTVWRWFLAYRAGGPAALARRIPSSKGQSRWFAAHREAAVLAAYLHLNERQSITFVSEQLRYEAKHLGLTEDELPSRETVRVFLSRAVSPALRTMAREGLTKYRETMSPYLKRAYGDMLANEIWVGDHGKHDVEVQNDLFEDVPYGTPGRLYASTFVDYRSRKAWMTWAWNPDSRSLSATLMRAMVETGETPSGLLLDNGKDMKKLARGGVHAPRAKADEEYEAQRTNWWIDEHASLEKLGFFTRLGIPVFHCLPRHGQAKHVERFFRTVRLRFDCIHSTYTSGSPFSRPEATEVAMMRHRRLLKAGRVGESTHPTASRFVLGCLSWLNEYNNTPQSGEGMEGMSPNQVYDATRNPNARPAPTPQQLVELMGERDLRQVHECAVQINKHRYTPRAEDRDGWAAMHEANSGKTKTKIMVAYNPAEPEFAIALTRDGRFLAWLEAEPLMRFAPYDPETQRQIGESMEMRRHLEKATRGTLTAIATTARANGARSAEEMLYGRLTLPANTGAVITQPKSHMRPDKTAVAPATATEIAADILEALK